MRQVKRLFYMVLLNVLISAITVGVILQLWERDHPPIAADATPLVIVVTPTQAVILPIISNNANPQVITPAEDGAVITGTAQATSTMEMLTYRIKEGDTLGALAVQFNIGVDDIMTVNNLTDPDSLLVGQIIYIPTAPLPKVTPTSITPTEAATVTPRPSSTPTRGPVQTSTPTASEQEAQLTISTVIGAGVLENERVVLLRTGDGELLLAGWRLTDGKGNDYTFPQLTLYKGGAINLNTRTGQNTVVDLFWGLTSPVWGSGKLIYIYDAQNDLRASYSIP